MPTLPQHLQLLLLTLTAALTLAAAAALQPLERADTQLVGYCFRDDKCSLGQAAIEVKPGQGTLIWADCLSFMSELHYGGICKQQGCKSCTNLERSPCMKGGYFIEYCPSINPPPEAVVVTCETRRSCWRASEKKVDFSSLCRDFGR